MDEEHLHFCRKSVIDDIVKGGKVFLSISGLMIRALDIFNDINQYIGAAI